MNINSKKSRTETPSAMTRSDLAKLGGGEIAYIRHFNAREAMRLFPAIKGIPENAMIFALHSADGTPLCVTDSQQVALAHAMDGELAVASVH